MALTYKELLLYLHITGRKGQNVSFQDRGASIVIGGKRIPIGGDISQFEANEHGIFIRNEQVVVSAACGHVFKTTDDVGGFCGVCKRLICAKEGCLAICEETGITVCRKDRIITRDGRIVSLSKAKDPMFIIKSLLMPKKKEIEDEERKKLPR